MIKNEEQLQEAVSVEQAGHTAGCEGSTSARMQRLAAEMRFRMREAAAHRGSSEAFLTWLREDDAKKA